MTTLFPVDKCNASKERNGLELQHLKYTRWMPYATQMFSVQADSRCTPRVNSNELYKGPVLRHECDCGRTKAKQKISAYLSSSIHLTKPRRDRCCTGSQQQIGRAACLLLDYIDTARCRCHLSRAQTPATHSEALPSTGTSTQGICKLFFARRAFVMNNCVSTTCGNY